MRIFKAINYDGTSPKTMSSRFHGKYILESCWEDLIKTAFSHISSGDKKKDKDYWISTTSSFHTAIEFMNNFNYDFNGIAIIDLPHTSETGRIFDINLRERGYIDKDIIDNDVKTNWTPNEDGIVVTIDTSSQLTINYLHSYLWLKGNIESLGNMRSTIYANSKDEILIMGENISFTYFSKDEVNEAIKSGSSIINNLKENKIPDFYTGLFKVFIEHAPDSEDKRKWLESLGIPTIEYDGYCENDPGEIERQKESIIQNSLEPFYGNVRYKYNRDRAKDRFYELHKLSYEDKEIIDFEKYEIVTKRDDIPLDDYIASYIYSSMYMNSKLHGKLEAKYNNWKILNYLYYQRFVDGEFEILVRNLDLNQSGVILNYYNQALGKYSSNFDSKNDSMLPYQQFDIDF